MHECIYVPFVQKKEEKKSTLCSPTLLMLALVPKSTAPKFCAIFVMVFCIVFTLDSKREKDAKVNNLCNQIRKIKNDLSSSIAGRMKCWRQMIPFLDI